MVDNVVIMAGGAGKRLWPASMPTRPKPFMVIDGESTLFHIAVERAFSLGISGTVYVVIHEDHIEAAVQDCLSLSQAKRERLCLMAEPLSRNTAPALALGSAGMILDGRGEQTLLVMTADHIISPIEAFTASVESASIEASNGYIVPYGLIPLEAATGFGYIEAGKAVGEGFEVHSFKEKPDQETARRYVDEGCYYWNAGIFTYRSDVFMEELSRFEPEIADCFSSPDKQWFHPRKEQGILILEPSRVLRKRYEGCPGKSVDYAVMERSSKIRMVKADFQWNDVGSWDEIAHIGMKMESPVYTAQASGNFVYSDKPVALCGVDNLIVVVANDRVMICRKGMSQLVKEVAEKDLA